MQETPLTITQKVEEFFSSYPLKTFDKGEVIVQAGRDLPGVFYITEGRVSQYDISPQGNTVVVNVFKPPAFFPMSWAINQTPNEYFFEATTDVKVHVAPAQDAVTFLKDNPDVTFDLLSRVYRGTDGLLRRMAHIMGGSAHTRLEFEVLNAARRFGKIQPDGSLFVPLNENELAAHSGLARETVNRNMKSLKETGLLEVARHGFIIKDIEAIEKSLRSAL